MAATTQENLFAPLSKRDGKSAADNLKAGTPYVSQGMGKNTAPQPTRLLFEGTVRVCLLGVGTLPYIF